MINNAPSIATLQNMVVVYMHTFLSASTHTDKLTIQLSTKTPTSYAKRNIDMMKTSSLAQLVDHDVACLRNFGKKVKWNISMPFWRYSFKITGVVYNTISLLRATWNELKTIMNKKNTNFNFLFRSSVQYFSIKAIISILCISTVISQGKRIHLLTSSTLHKSCVMGACHKKSSFCACSLVPVFQTCFFTHIVDIYKIMEAALLIFLNFSSVKSYFLQILVHGNYWLGEIVPMIFCEVPGCASLHSWWLWLRWNHYENCCGIHFCTLRLRLDYLNYKTKDAMVSSKS